MATDADVISYLWWTTVVELEADYTEAINTYDINLSTNSWGFLDWDGEYDIYTQAEDDVITGAYGKRISLIYAAGNEGDDFGWTSLRSNAVAKNIITVGATNSDDDSLWSESSRGPAADGRIKPDLVAPGCQAVPAGQDDGIVSTIPCNTYGVKCGTSMAAPAVSGSIALMLEYWEDTHSSEGDPLPSTIKAILIQTAKDLGNTGPDYSFGYGLIDMVNAIDLIDSDDASKRTIIEDSISDQGETDYYTVYVPYGQDELKITLVWDDYPGDPAAAEALVNDLDLIVTEPNGTRRYPWTLDPTPGNEGNPAVQTQEDHTNNVEQVYIDNPAKGRWRIEVKGTLNQPGEQQYSLVSNNLSFAAKFLVRDSSGQDTAWFDSFGNLVLIGTLHEQQNVQETGQDEFVFKDSGGNNMAKIIMSSGHMYIKGVRREEGQNWQAPLNDDFIIKGAGGDIVAYIDELSGDVYLKGNVYEDWVPNP